MYSRDKLENELTRDEGDKKFPYTDTVGKITIGKGHNLTDNGLSDNIRHLIFEEDLAEVERVLQLTLPWVFTLDDVRQRVFLNMCFNMGIKTLLTFTTFLKFAKAGDWTHAAEAMLHSKWAAQVGARAVRLARMMQTGTL